MQLADLGEFALIDRIARLARARDGARARGPGVVLGIGDDAAILRARPGEDTVVTCDTFVEGVHFRFETEDARAVGRRALAANLSDLAAMGARPLGFTLALAAPPELAVSRVDGVARGLRDLAQRFSCPLVGGNVTRAEATHLAITAVGAVRRGRALRRGAARPGDRILVTGRFGGAALALARAERGLARLRRVPDPRVAAGCALARLPGIGACIDISDGLVADLRHVLSASGAGAAVDARRVPRPRGFAAACASLGLDPERLVFAGGQDYELLFTVRPGGPDPARLRRRLGLPLAEIGRITAGGLEGIPERVEGWRHF